MTTLLQRYERLLADGELKPDPDQRRVAQRLDRLAHELEEQPSKGTVLWRMLRRKPEPIRGVYLWGGVGRGKSMLMDLLYDSAHVRPKRRVHFHEFMLDVHERIREERRKEEGDPIPPVAAAIASEARLLAFDEMVINNTADAAIMSRLFTAIIEHGTTIVTTSNRIGRAHV